MEKNHKTEGIKPWSIKKESLDHSTRVFDVTSRIAVSADGDNSGEFVVLKLPDWVNVIAVTPDNHVILVEQYRHGMNTITLEIPGGVIEKHHSEPVEAARSELTEETGYTAEKWTYLGGVAVNPAIMNNRCHLFLAENCTLTHPQDLDQHEDIRVHLRSMDDFLEAVRTGEIDHSLVTAAVSMYLLHQRASG